jgi:hypothetical protein
MKQCTKCKVEKELDKFQKYWHSTQNKQRTRGECTECYYKQKNERQRLRRKEANLIQVSIRPEIIQPVQPELQPAILENNPNYRQCKSCHEYKELDKFYKQTKTKTTFLQCKSCMNAAEYKKYKSKRAKDIEKNGGSLRRYEAPNKWMDDYQRDATHNILKAMGWSFNEENGIWWKEGIKTEDGIFINVRYKSPLDKINKKYLFGEYPESIRSEKQKELFNTMIDLRKNGMTFKSIANKLGVADSTVHKWLKSK